MANNPHRATCPDCGRELIYASIIVGFGTAFNAWICDCDQQPEGVSLDIIQAREWLDQALIYTVEINGSEPA